MFTHTDTARSAALMPGERCPAPCVACAVPQLLRMRQRASAGAYAADLAPIVALAIRPGRPLARSNRG